jgi:hypothetical protein
MDILKNKDPQLVDYDKDSEEEMQELRELILGDEDVEKDDEEEDEELSEDDEDNNFIVPDDYDYTNSSDEEKDGGDSPSIRNKIKPPYINPENIGKPFII